MDLPPRYPGRTRRRVQALELFDDEHGDLTGWQPPAAPQQRQALADAARDYLERIADITVADADGSPLPDGHCPTCRQPLPPSPDDD